MHALLPKNVGWNFEEAFEYVLNKIIHKISNEIASDRMLETV
jgi:hypothetical protein